MLCFFKVEILTAATMHFGCWWSGMNGLMEREERERRKNKVCSSWLSMWIDTTAILLISSGLSFSVRVFSLSCSSLFSMAALCRHSVCSSPHTYHIHHIPHTHTPHSWKQPYNQKDISGPEKKNKKKKSWRKTKTKQKWQSLKFITSLVRFQIFIFCFHSFSHWTDPGLIFI